MVKANKPGSSGGTRKIDHVTVVSRPIRKQPGKRELTDYIQHRESTMSLLTCWSRSPSASCWSNGQGSTDRDSSSTRECGEMAVSGPTAFIGYIGSEEINRSDLQNGCYLVQHFL
jgi:hypothetical protein